MALPTNPNVWPKTKVEKAKTPTPEFLTPDDAEEVYCRHMGMVWRTLDTVTNTFSWTAKEEVSKVKSAGLTNAEIEAITIEGLDLERGRQVKKLWAVESTITEACAAFSGTFGLKKRSISKYYAIYNRLYDADK